MNESEPLMKCRENELPVKTAVVFVAEEECSRNLFTGYMAGVIKEA
jgi:hypothetical protein